MAELKHMITHDHNHPTFWSQVVLIGFCSLLWKTIFGKTSVPALETIAVDLGSPYMQKVEKTQWVL